MGIANSRADLKVEYLNSTMSVRELCEKHGLKLTTVARWAVDDHWNEERKELTRKVAKEAGKRQLAQRIKDLSEWNSADLALAKAIRSQVAEALTIAQKGKLKADGTRDARTKETIPVRDLQMLASIVETTQRIGRIALGVSPDGVIDDSDDEDGIGSIVVQVRAGRLRPKEGADGQQT